MRLRWPGRRPRSREVPGLRVIVTAHALDRSRERVDAGFTHERVLLDVLTAMLAGRVGRQVTHPDTYARAAGRARLAWTEDGRVAYVIRYEPLGWVVVSTLRPRVLAPVTEARLRALQRRFGRAAA